MILRNPAAVHKPLAAYSHQAEIGPEASWLVMSGQVGMNQDGSVPEDTMEQMKTALDNVAFNLAAANMEKENLVKLVFYFVGSHDAEKRRRVISDYFGEHRPCTTVIYVAGLANPALKVEIDAWACRE